MKLHNVFNLKDCPFILKPFAVTVKAGKYHVYIRCWERLSFNLDLFSASENPPTPLFAVRNLDNKTFVYCIFYIFFVYCRGFCILKKIFLALSRREEKRNGSLRFIFLVYIHIGPQISVIIWRTSVHQQRVFFKFILQPPSNPPSLSSVPIERFF